MEGFELLFRALEAAGPTTIMAVFLVMFLRGDIISSKTVQQIIDGIVAEISTRIISAIQAEIEELRDDLQRAKKKSDPW